MNSVNGPVNHVPLVSVVMPVYNAMPYLEMAIKSIFAQSIQDWELILVDDRSTDGSWEFLRTLRDPRLRLFRNDRNRGHSYSKNRCVQEASGRYIASMDADDISLPTRLARQLQILEGSQKADVVGCGVIKVDRDLRLLQIPKVPTEHKEIIKLVHADIRFFFGPYIQMTDGTILARREWFRKWQYDTRVKVSEDFDLMLKAYQTSKYANAGDPLYVYIRSGTTANISAQLRSILFKLRSLFLYGFRTEMILQSFLAVVSLAFRPGFILATEVHHWVISRREPGRQRAAEKEPYWSEISHIHSIVLPKKDNEETN